VVRYLVGAICLVFGLVVSPAAYADTEIYALPTGWRLQNYVSASGLVAWFSGSTCTNGLLSFSPAATTEDRNRFYSLIVSAKISGKAVGVFYETTSGSCQITSFYLQQ
jgi:hypothetical protein